MINLLVRSALQTGCISVASESLLRQLLQHHLFQATDLQDLTLLEQALLDGKVKREGNGRWELTPISV